MRIGRNIGRIIVRYPLSLIILCVIVYLSLFKPVATNSLYKIPYIDKIAHFLMYAGFCSILWFEHLRSHYCINIRKIILWAIVSPILFSGIMEVVQGHLTEYRTADWEDFFFNALGVLSAAVFSVYVTLPLVRKYSLYRKNIEN